MSILAFEIARMRACGCPDCIETLEVYCALFGQFAAPPPEPEPVISRIQRVYNRPAETARDQERADFGDWLSEMFGWVWDCEEAARVEDHIDQQVENRARIDEALERRRRRAK